MTLKSSSPRQTTSVAVGPELRVRIPDHVAHRAFPGQTVLLNFQSGEYHGLGGAGAPMLEALRDGHTVGQVSAGIAARYGIDLADAQRDVAALCSRLLARGLIEPV
jgi:Coenzyme PQQ synthesis protein D (PqqD)